jgi:hypothetical protein
MAHFRKIVSTGGGKKKSTNPKVFELERKFHFNQED